jgi:LexA-binding, inner membrane-associated putative hydrolase
MPSPIGHTLGAYATLLALDPSLARNRRTNSLALGTAFVFGSLADADFIVAYFTSNPVLRHHYFSHSVPFAILIGVLSFITLKALHYKKAGWYTLLLTAAYGSHLLLDYFAYDGGYPYGIPLFWPLTNRHFLAPIWIFQYINRGEWGDLFGWHNFHAVLIEIAVTGPLALLAYARARRINASANQERKV